jgi:Protein of unknown function (DUF742)
MSNNDNAKAEGLTGETNEEGVAPRAFVNRRISLSESDSYNENAKDGVRAYMMTGGRTAAKNLGYESMVSATPASRHLDLRFERKAIVDLCGDGAQSIAELSARLTLPIGATRVIASDLVEEKALDVHTPNLNMSKDVAMLRKLISGVRAL